MTRRVKALVSKDLAAHGWTVVALAALTAVALATFMGVALAGETLASRLEVIAWTHAGVLPLAALVLGHRLVVAEYHAHTQLFVEALPGRRVEMVLVKYLLGLAVLLALAWAVTAAAAQWAHAHEPVGARFFAIMLARGGAWIACVWTVLFAMGFAGRYRGPIYVAMGLASWYVSSHTTWEPRRFGPFALIDPGTFAFERDALPARALQETELLTAAWLAAAVALALAREGTVAEALARRMSRAEKMLVTGVLAAFVIALSLAEERRAGEPFEFRSAHVARHADVPVVVEYPEDAWREDAEALVAHLAPMLDTLREALHLATLPPVRIAAHPRRDGRAFSAGDPGDDRTVLLRARYQDEDFPLTDFTTEAVRETLLGVTNGRADFETRRWLHDGFSRWWAEEHTPADAGRERRLVLRALVAMRLGTPTRDTVLRWDRYRERVGPEVAEAVAWSAVRFLAQAHGRARVLALASALLGRRARGDVRDTIAEWRHPMTEVFARTVGVTWDTFVTQWHLHLDALHQDPDVAVALAAIPQLSAAIDPAVEGGSERPIGHHVRADPPLPAGTVWALVHKRLSPWDEEIDVRSLQRDGYVWASEAGADARTLRGSYGAGERVFLAVEVEPAALGCPLRLAATRLDLP
jgi:hypothetical protein